MDMSKIYKKILYLELNYSLYLTANILKFYGYNFKTFKDFFSGRGEKKFCPVLIWEYVIIRTQLFLNIDKVLDLVGPSTFIIDQNNKNNIIKLMEIDDNLINKLSILMEMTKPIKNISYTMIDLNWNLI